MAGYSGTPLAKKLGLKPGQSAVVVREPKEFRKELGKLPDGLKLTERVAGDHDYIHIFSKSRAELEYEISRLGKQIVPNGMIWVSWPKKASGVATDITEDVVRAIALKNGLVDVKVCAVDETWSGLKLVIPVKLRKNASKTASAR
jgi:hypothetical protein